MGDATAVAQARASGDQLEDDFQEDDNAADTKVKRKGSAKKRNAPTRVKF